MISNFKNQIKNFNSLTHYGKITKITGNLIESSGPSCELGELCYIQSGTSKIYCEVIGFNNNSVVLMPFDDVYGIKLGDKIYGTGGTIEINISDDLKGHIINGIGKPIDPNIIIKKGEKTSIYSKPVSSLSRKIINEPLESGVKAIDSLIPIGKGQRIGIFAGSGVGKTSLLSMIAKKAKADINIICLVGERGREVKEFIEHDLGEEGMKRSIVVVSTSDEPALMRIKAALTATAIAEHFRDKGLDVILMMDSVTRFAMAQREIGVSTGEKVAQRGYTPSTFAMIPKLLERAGTSDTGTITGIYTVLVDGDDMNEPIADTTRGVLDGHIVLDRKLAHKGHYPAINISASVSRVIKNICTEEHINDMNQFRALLASYSEVEDLITIGAYKEGANAQADRAIKLRDKSMNFLKQGINEYYTRENTISMLNSIVNVE